VRELRAIAARCVGPSRPDTVEATSSPSPTHRRRVERRDPGGFRTRPIEVELSSAIIPQLEATGGGVHALVLVRLHSVPLGLVRLDLSPRGLTGAEIAAEIWPAVREAARSHLHLDGLRAPAELPLEGLQSLKTPGCVCPRDSPVVRTPSSSVIVATRERPGQLGRCVHSLLELEYQSFEIIVVDSGPISTATRKLIQNDFEGKVQYVRASRPGLALAHNEGLSHAEGSIVAFVDDDVVVDRDWLASVVRGFHAADGVACVTGLILPLRIETPAQEWVVKHTRLSKGFERRIFGLGANCSPRPLYPPLYPYTAGMFGSGANMAFSADFLRDIGGFDVALGAGTPARGGDDLAAFFEVIQQGRVLVYEPRAVVWHDYRDDIDSLPKHFFTYGVGLSAYLAKTIVDRPSSIARLVALLPQGIGHMRRLRSRESLGAVPRRLIAREWLGMLVGPAAYLISRRRMRALSSA
jgi:GT2 family glycosyltransferase